MAAIDFPSSPSNGDTHTVGGVTYTYNSAETKWKTTVNSNAFLPLTGGTVSGNIDLNGNIDVDGNVVLNGELHHSGDTDTNIAFGTNEIQFDTAGSERFRVGSAGQLGIGGATYGSSGQVLTSGGASAAPQWASAATATAIQDTSAGTEDEYTFTNIPTWVNVIIINFHDVSLDVNNDIRIQLGNNGTYYNSNYRSTSSNGAGSAGVYRTDSFGIDSVGTGNVMNGQMVLTCLRRRTADDSGLWSQSHQLMNSNTGFGIRHGGGRFINGTANGDIDCIRIYATTDTTDFDNGRISLTYF